MKNINEWRENFYGTVGDVRRRQMGEENLDYDTGP